MEICGRHFSTEVIERIQSAVDADPSLSRRALSRQVCEWLDWRAPNGKLQEMSCRVALLRLHERGVLSLPDCSAHFFSGRERPSSRSCLPELPEVCCSFEELGGIEIVPVRSRYSQSSSIWNELMGEFHYLGAGPLCGAQIRYLVKSSEYGWVGGLGFSSATWRLKARDEWIGWSEAARRANLQKVVLNSRFLILPSVHVPNLASHSLSMCLARLETDWHERYGYEPVLVETFVDPRRFSGACYQAANWTHIGQTAGGKDTYPNGKTSDGVKDIYVKRLKRDYKEVLCARPETPLMSRPRPEAPADWVEEEFGSVGLYDERLKNRLYTLTRDFYAQPTALIPQICSGSVAKLKGAYRFFKNPQIHMDVLLQPHTEATIERIREHPVVLSAQDTTTLNYTAHPATEDLGPINTKEDGAIGLILHDTLAFTPQGVPLGVLDAQCWARDPAEAGKREKRKELPIEEKESYKWIRSYQATAKVQSHCPDTMLVSVGDRESDIFELFDEQRKTPAGPELLVRAEHSRNRKVGDQTLWEKMGAEKIAGYREFHVPRKGRRPARNVKLAVRFAKVTLTPPKDKALDPVEVWAVYAKEVGAPKEIKEPVEWMLLTTVATETFEDACERLDWYAGRWGIEVYHRVLKSGCRIEDRRLDNADSIASCLAIDMVIAWRIFLLVKEGREHPDIPCDVYLAEEEWHALWAHEKQEAPPKTPPTLREAVRMIAALGGFLGRKCDGEAGATTLWRGLQRLADITYTFVVAKKIYANVRSP